MGNLNIVNCFGFGDQGWGTSSFISYVIVSITRIKLQEVQAREIHRIGGMRNIPRNEEREMKEKRQRVKDQKKD